METEAAASAAAVQAVGFIHPVMADVMTILSFVLVVAAVAIAAVATLCVAADGRYGRCH